MNIMVECLVLLLHIEESFGSFQGPEAVYPELRYFITFFTHSTGMPGL
jgi:hypothetical protein